MNAAEVVCGGFCKATFHYSCAKISEALYKEITNNPSIFWMCKGCLQIMGNARFKNTLNSMNAATKEMKDVYQKLVDELKSEIKGSLIAELKQEIQGGFNKLSPAILSPIPNRFQFNSRPATKRTRELDDIAFAVSDRPSKILRGTGQSSSSFAVNSDNKFWLYLTKISPDVTEDDIKNLTKSCLKVDDAVVKALVPKGRPVSTMSFISFKVGISEALKAKAMDTSTWPPEIQFREFIDNSPITQHFWKPGQNTNPGVPSILECNPPTLTNLMQQ